MWRLPGVDPRLRRAELSFGPPATLIAVLGLLTFAPACAYAASQDAPQESDGSDPGRSAYAAGRFIDALRIWWPRAEQGDARAAFGLGLLYDLGEGVGQNAPAAYSWYRRAAEAGYVPANSILLLCLTVAPARRAIRQRPPRGMRARLRMAMRGLNITWRSSMRRATACRAISTWRRAGTPRPRGTGSPPRLSSFSRCARRGVSQPCRLQPQTRRWPRQSQPGHPAPRRRAPAPAPAPRSNCPGQRQPSLCQSSSSSRSLHSARMAPIASSPSFQNSRQCWCRCHGRRLNYAWRNLYRRGVRSRLRAKRLELFLHTLMREASWNDPLRPARWIGGAKETSALVSSQDPGTRPRKAMHARKS